MAKLKKYTIAYKTEDDCIFRETIIEATNKRDALQKLYEQLGNKEFDYDGVYKAD